jgi:ABC-type sugar transport system ATPase subunit
MKPLVVEGVTVLREGHLLLEQIRCEIRSGQVSGIISDNPERLQLLLNILGGVEQEQTGKILFAGKPWTNKQRLRGVGIAREQVSLVDSLSVLDNLFLSNNRLYTWLGFIHRSRRRKHAQGVLRQLESQVSLDWPLQRVEPNTKVMLDIARVLIKDPDYFIFNGVTRAMSLRQYEAFLALVRGLKSGGKGVIVIPINTEDVRTLVDRLYFLQGTQLFEIDQGKDLSDEQLHDFFLGNEKKRYKTTNDPVQRAKQTIQERFAEEEIDFQQLAETLAMSYDNFRRRFKAQIGQSPNQYFLSVKMDRAKEFLLFTDQEVKDIALELGFSDPYYFSRVFKERTGTSPVHFRNGNRDGTETL